MLLLSAVTMGAANGDNRIIFHTQIAAHKNNKLVESIDVANNPGQTK